MAGVICTFGEEVTQSVPWGRYDSGGFALLVQAH